jgi:hypothetical protein
VIAAHQEAARRHFSSLKVGFNWSYQGNPQVGSAFWRDLGSLGGARFRQSADWVGLDSYPDTFATTVPSRRHAADAAATLVRGLQILRSCYLPLTGISRRVPLHVSENGYPTGPGRSPRQQAAVLRAEVSAVNRFRRTFNVTDYRWFDLRDGNSSDSALESGYGLTRDDYQPKPAFTVFQHLISALSTS